MSKVTVILNRVNSEAQGGFDKEVITLAIDPNWSIPAVHRVNGHNYEARQKGQEGGVVTYSLCDSAIPQD